MNFSENQELLQEEVRTVGNIIPAQNNLPDNIEDLSKFVLVGREKLVSVKAEIRAIDKLNLATEVRDQKKEECSMLAEALLDAETRLGDLLKQIPKDNRFKGNQYKEVNSQQCDISKEICQKDSSVHSAENNRIGSRFEKPKHEVIEELGFNRKQANRFEILANNKDLVEQVKQEARENDDIPTRTRVLELARARKKKQDGSPLKEPDGVEEYCKYMDECKSITVKFNNTLLKLSLLDVDDRTLGMWGKLLDKDDIERKIEKVETAIPKLLKIQKFLRGVLKNG